jgi:hypothetical protein
MPANYLLIEANDWFTMWLIHYLKKLKNRFPPETITFYTMI